MGHQIQRRRNRVSKAQKAGSPGRSAGRQIAVVLDGIPIAAVVVSDRGGHGGADTHFGNNGMVPTCNDRMPGNAGAHHPDGRKVEPSGTDRHWQN